jgi:hypothetical protein
MTIPTLTTLPVAPARTDPPATFVTRADAFLAAIVTFQGEMNTSIGAMNTDIAQVNTDATNAAADAVSAAASAAAAEAASNATEWVSGTSYSSGDVVYSPINYLSYRANTATSGTTDPSLSADWDSLTYQLPTQSGNSGKFLTTDGTNESWGLALPDQTGNAGKYLTTDGSNDSWGDVAASAKVNATADGPLADGDKVIIQSDGTVKKVTQTSPGSDMSITTGVQFVAATTEYILSIDTKPNDDTVFAFATQSGKLFMCKNTSGTLSVLASTTATSANRSFSGAFNPTHPDNFVTIEVFSNYIRNRVFVLNPSAPSITEVGNLQTGGQIFGDYTNVFMDGSTFYTLGKNTGSTPSILSGSFSSANTATTSWTVTTIAANSAWTRANMAVNNGVTLACTTTVNYSYLTGNNGTNNDIWLLQTVEQVIIRPCTGQAGKFIMTYRAGINYYIRIAIVVSGRVSLGDPVLVPDAYSFSGLFVDEDTPTKAVVSYPNKFSAVGAAYRTLTINYSTNTIEMSEAFTTDSNYANAITYSGASGEFYTVTSDGTDMDGQIFTKEVLAVTNLTDDNFLGISDGVYSDTETAGIQVISAIDDAQSGLTTGLKYYVQPDNTLATTPSNPEVYAGIAISATELLIKG